MATEFKLPDAMPTRWLDDIKSSVKEGRKGLIIGTILGSSLITGLVTTALGLFVQVMVEGTKTSLELRAEDAKETVRKYNVLRDNLNDLKYDLATSTVAFRPRTRHAMPCPIPSLAPVTIATRPGSRPSFSSLRSRSAATSPTAQGGCPARRGLPASWPARAGED